MIKYIVPCMKAEERGGNPVPLRGQ